MKKLFLSSFMMNVAVMLLNIATGILIARWLGPHARGEFAAATRWAALFVSLSAVGLPGAMIYLGKHFRDRQRELFSAYLTLGFLFGLAGLGAGLLLLPGLMAGQPQRLIDLSRIAFLCLPFAVLTDGLIGTLQSLNLFRRVMLLRLLSPLGTLLVIAALSLAGGLNVAGLIWLNTVGWGFLTFVLTLIWVFRSLRPRWRGLAANARELIRHGVKIYGGSLVSVFGGSFDQLVLSLAMPTYALGLYAVAGSIGGMLPSVLFGALNVFLWPKLMDLPEEKRQRKAEQIHGWLFHGTAAAAIAGAALLPFALPLLYGREYEPAVRMGILLLLASPVRIGCTVFLQYLNTKGKFHTVSLSELISVAAGFVSMLLLLPVAGETAAAWGMAAAAVAKWLYVARAARKLGIRLRASLRPAGLPERLRSFAAGSAAFGRRIGRKRLEDG